MKWGDEGVAKLLAALPRPQDPDGIPREYAAGSAENDYLQNERGSNTAAAEKYPTNYAVGQLAGAAPIALAVPGGMGGSTAARIAAGGLVGGAQGGLAGAGAAEDGTRARGAAQGALMGAPLGVAGAAAPAALGAGKKLIDELRGPGNFPPGPAVATAGAQASQAPRAVGQATRPANPQVGLNFDAGRPAVPPGRRLSGQFEMPEIPKASKPLVSEGKINVAEDLADSSMNMQGSKNLGKASNPEDVRVAREALRKLEKPDEAAGSVRPPTARPPRRSKAEPRPTQQKLPNVPEAEYQYHATPPENKTAIAELGLRPELGGKNFAFKKNQGRVYMSGPEEASMWAQKLEDFSGQKPLELRTPLASEAVPGADKAVRMRTEAVPPSRLQYKSGSGQWRSVTDLLEQPQTETGVNPDQLELLH